MLRDTLDCKTKHRTVPFSSVNASSARIYHVRDNVLRRRPLVHSDTLNEELVLAVVVRGNLLGRLHRNYTNFTVADENDRSTKRDTDTEQTGEADALEMPNDPLGGTTPEAGRTAYFLGFVVFTCRFDGTKEQYQSLRG